LYQETDISYADLSNEELMVYLREGKEMAFNEIYKRFSMPLYWFFIQKLDPKTSKAEDFLQDLFIKIIENAESFDSNKNFKTWLYTLAYNMCKNEYRRNNIRQGNIRIRDLNTTKVPHGNLEEMGSAYDLELFGKKLRLELNKLDQKYSMTFILRHEHGLSIKSVAQVMCCPEGTVKSRLFYAIRHLSNRLKLFKCIKL